jgi:uncharacterized protein
VSAFAAAEADYLILDRLDVDAQLAFLKDLAETYSVQALDAAGLRRARQVCERYRALRLGLADASNVVLAAEWRTHAVATFDERDFRAVTALDGRPFTLLPIDGA